MREKIKILVIDDLHPVFFEKTNKNLFDIIYLPEIEADNIADSLIDIDVLILRSKVTVNQNICKYANKLKLVARAGSGIDNLDIEWLENNGINIINTPEANSTSVAEHTAGMLLALMANIVKGDREVKSKIWDREGNRGEELQGKTIGIIGFGNTGSRFSKVISGFGVKVLAYDKYKSGFSDEFAEETEMSEIFNKTDILSLHIPLTNETRNLINIDFINKFKKPIILLNTSRGEIVNTRDVIGTIEKGWIKGLATDVLENEKIRNLNKAQSEDFEKLCKFDNVILTPHIAGWTIESYRKISEILSEKITEFYSINIGRETDKRQKV